MSLDNGEAITCTWPQNIYVKSPSKFFGSVLFASALG